MAPPRTVLVVDDDAYILRVIELKLKTHGYGVFTAANGGEGLDMVERIKPDVLITDINMPKMDGETLCLRTNSLKRSQQFLTIVLSARIGNDNRQWVKELENTRFIEKPFSPSQLLRCLDEYFAS